MDQYSVFILKRKLWINFNTRQFQYFSLMGIFFFFMLINDFISKIFGIDNLLNEILPYIEYRPCYGTIFVGSHKKISRNRDTIYHFDTIALYMFDVLSDIFMMIDLATF